MSEWVFEELGRYWLNNETDIVIWGEDMPWELTPLSGYPRLQVP
jgi:hypothetical protein